MQEQPSTATPSGTSRSALLIVFLVVVIDLLGFGIVLPLLPLYATDLLGPLYPETEAGHHFLHGVLLGALMSLFSLMQFIFAPIWGRVSDRVGRRPILMLGLAGSVVFYALFGIASEVMANGKAAHEAGQEGAEGLLRLALVLMFLARIGAGVAGATIATAQAVIADTTTPEKRAHGMALIGIAFGIGFAIGPLVGLASLFFPFKGAPGFAAATLSLIALLLAIRLLPETCRPGSAPPRRWLDWGGLIRALRTPTVGTLILIFFLATFAFGGLESTLALVNRLLLTGEVAREMLTTDRVKESSIEQKNFLIFAYVGVVLMLVQGGIYRRMVHRVGEVRFMRLGIGLMALGLLGGVGVLLLAGSEDTSRTLLIVLALDVFTVAVMGFAFLTPSVQALISRRSDPTRQGEVLGVNQSASALARILGPFLSIMLFFATPSHVLPYTVGAGLLAVVFFLSLRIPVSSDPGERMPHDVQPQSAPLAQLDAQRICIIKPSALGDIIHALPVLTALRHRFPQAHISWVVNRSYEPLLAGHPDLNEALPYDRGLGRNKGWWAGLANFGSFLGALTRKQFDLVLDLQGLLRSGLMTRATRAARRVGLPGARESAAWFYTDVVPGPTRTDGHAVDRYWSAAQALGAVESDRMFRLPAFLDEHAWAGRGLLACPRPWIMTGVGSRWETKRWPPAHFGELLRRAQQSFGGTIVFVGGPEDMPASVEAGQSLSGPCLVLAGQTTLPQLAALLARADVMVANDTGPLHLACALGRPVIAPYTCTKAALTGPFGQLDRAVETSVWCAGSLLKRCARMECMQELGPDRLWPVLREVLLRWEQTSRSA